MNLTTLNQILTTIFKSITIRVHSALGRYAWARAWYLCRGLDVEGVGILKNLSLTFCCDRLHCSTSTFYRYLKEGQAAGAFRKYQLVGGKIDIYLGALQSICQKQSIQDFGVVGYVPFWESYNQLRQITTRLITQKLQLQSYQAANFNLTQLGKRNFKPPTAQEIIAAATGPSQKRGEGDLAYVVHMGKRRLFVSYSFVRFGASQRGIAQRLNLSEKTIQRHLVGVERRQLMQAKADYRRVRLAINNEAPYAAISPEIQIEKIDEVYQLREKVRGGKNWGEAKEVQSRSFHDYFQKCWIHGCNIYDELFILCRMNAAKDRLKKLFEKPTADIEPFGEAGG